MVNCKSTRPGGLEPPQHILSSPGGRTGDSLMKHLLKIGIAALLLTAGIAAAGDLQLSPQERAWLAEHPTIRISGPQAFPPFQYFDDDGVFKGMASDYLQFIASMAGLRIEVTGRQPWEEILHKVENREIDLLTCAAVTAERSRYLIYTRPYLTFPLVIVSRKDAPFISGVESLHGQRLAVTRKNSTLEWLQRDSIRVATHFVDSPLQGLQDISLGQADVAIENLATATYLIEKYGLTNLKIAAPTNYEDYSLAIAVRSDWPELADILDKGLAAMPREQHDRIRQKWIPVRYEHGLGIADIVTWAGLVGGVAAILLAISYYWNSRLAREIQERKRVEADKERLIVELRQALGNIKTLHGILPICSECKSIRDDKGYWRQIEAYIGEHSDADFSHSLCPKCMEKLYGSEKWYADSLGARDDSAPAGPSRDRAVATPDHH